MTHLGLGPLDLRFKDAARAVLREKRQASELVRFTAGTVSEPDPEPFYRPSVVAVDGPSPPLDFYETRGEETIHVADLSQGHVVDDEPRTVGTFALHRTAFVRFQRNGKASGRQWRDGGARVTTHEFEVASNEPLSTKPLLGIKKGVPGHGEGGDQAKRVARQRNRVDAKDAPSIWAPRLKGYIGHDGILGVGTREGQETSDVTIVARRPGRRRSRRDDEREQGRSDVHGR